MADDATNAIRGIEHELDTAFSSLESALNQAGRAASELQSLGPALTQAGRAVTELRGLLPQVIALAETIDELEATISRVRQRRSVSPQSAGPDIGLSSEPPAVSKRHATAPCLLLDVRSPSGSLDLKALDGSVGESPDVADVALLDYDGGRASLKVWLDTDADPMAVRETLLESLERHLSNDPGAEISVELEREAAA